MQTMRDKLIDLLDDFISYEYNTEELVDTLIAHGVTVQEWISVEDRLPTEADGTVFVCFADMFPYNRKEPYPNAKHDGRVSIATHSEFSKRWYSGGGGLLQDGVVTHWMPLPQPPKGE